MTKTSTKPPSTQNREPPAYQEYAAAMMARREYRLLSLAERGLLYSMRLECWCNHDMPADPGALARLLGFDRAEVEAALPNVMPFFSCQGGLFVSPELEDLRKCYADRRAKQVAGGEESAKRREEERLKLLAESHAKGTDSPAGNLQGTSKQPASTLASTLQVCRPDQTKPDQSKAVSRKEGFPPICDEYREWMGDPVSSERPGMVEVEI